MQGVGPRLGLKIALQAPAEEKEMAQAGVEYVRIAVLIAKPAGEPETGFPVEKFRVGRTIEKRVDRAAHQFKILRREESVDHAPARNPLASQRRVGRSLGAAGDHRGLKDRHVILRISTAINHAVLLRGE